MPPSQVSIITFDLEWLVTKTPDFVTLIKRLLNHQNGGAHAFPGYYFSFRSETLVLVEYYLISEEVIMNLNRRRKKKAKRKTNKDTPKFLDLIFDKAKDTYSIIRSPQ